VKPEPVLDARILDFSIQDPADIRFNDVMIHDGAAALLTNHFLRNTFAAVTE
jgi:hypothetical protein